MIKTLKWVYDLGVRQERVRIAAHLQVESQRTQISRDTTIDMLRDASNKRLSQDRKARLEFAIAVNNRVEEIIANIFKADETWVLGTSLMFPNDKHKGEL